MSYILEKLKGGDLRSIGQANEVALEIENKPSHFKHLFNGLFDEDPVVRMRSADVIEKVTQRKPELLSAYTSKILKLLTTSEQKEVCWHMAQIAPRLICSKSEENKIIASLKIYLMHKSKIVQVSAMESLAAIAERNNSKLKEIIE